MSKRIISLVAALALSGCAQKHTARNCDQAVEAAYQFTERAINLRPELAYAPVRNEATARFFGWLVVMEFVKATSTTILV